MPDRNVERLNNDREKRKEKEREKAPETEQRNNHKERTEREVQNSTGEFARIVVQRRERDKKRHEDERDKAIDRKRTR